MPWETFFCPLASELLRSACSCSDEHWLPTLIAALGREDETDCHGYLTNVDWSRGGGHPRSYEEKEISAARWVVQASGACHLRVCGCVCGWVGVGQGLTSSPSLLIPVAPGLGISSYSRFFGLSE